MPVKGLISLTAVALLAIAISGGPYNFDKNLTKVKYTILKEFTRTDNWGNPSPWAKQNKHPHPFKK